MKFRCDNCEFEDEEVNLPMAKDLASRLAPGDQYTDRECPKCGCLCFPVVEVGEAKEVLDFPPLPEVPTNHEMGKCPKCGGNLDYGCGEPSDDSQYFYYWKCTECHATGKEWYKMTFIEHTVDE